MENNTKFDAQKMAEELWADLEANADNLRTDATKRAHTNAFFRQKQVTKVQAQAVITELTKQLEANKEFSSLPQVMELYDFWTRKQFQYFFKDPDVHTLQLNTKALDLTRYFEEKKIPIWQRDQIVEHFHAYMIVKSSENRKKVLVPLLVCYGSALILSFLTPMIMQRLGILAPDAGWGIKTINVLGGLFFLFLIARRVNSFWLDKVLLDK
jgi:hypothetical protein